MIRMNKRFMIITLFLASFLYCCLSGEKEDDYYNPKVLATHFDGEQFVGSVMCKECHSDTYASHINTAHFNTSAIASSENIKGSFKAGSNTLDWNEVEFVMKSERNSFYQTTKIRSTNEQMTPVKIDITVGSGVKGQSYLTWENENLFQIQASYYPPSDRWIISPGLPTFDFKRPIRDGCLKCHVTFAANRDFSGQGNQYDKERMIYGIDCEKCHRPSARHVIYHRKNPKDTVAKYMLRLDTLSRQLRLDVCAQCHSGPRDNLIKGNSFSFLSGENLDEYSRNFRNGRADSILDVHGNQYGLLISSKCFKQSNEFDCRMCHDPHKNQRGDTKYFNQKCTGCHGDNSTFCMVDPFEMKAMASNCIGCHMPITPSKLMSVQLTGDSMETPVYIRTHLIGIYSKDLWHN